MVRKPFFLWHPDTVNIIFTCIVHVIPLWRVSAANAEEIGWSNVGMLGNVIFRNSDSYIMIINMTQLSDCLSAVIYGLDKARTGSLSICATLFSFRHSPVIRLIL
jgi:hypothetical protein